MVVLLQPYCARRQGGISMLEAGPVAEITFVRISDQEGNRDYWIGGLGFIPKPGDSDFRAEQLVSRGEVRDLVNRIVKKAPTLERIYFEAGCYKHLLKHGERGKGLFEVINPNKNCIPYLVLPWKADISFGGGLKGNN